MIDPQPPDVDEPTFRFVLGHVPTGVAVVAGLTSEGAPGGLAVGSFSSVSLDPPLVAFFVAHTSTSWPAIRGRGSFCINVLSCGQEVLCRSFSARGGDRLADVSWTPAPLTATPRLAGTHAWVECTLREEIALGDHLMVVGVVRGLQASAGDSPLVFYRGDYHGVTSVTA